MQLSEIRQRLIDVYGNTLTSESTFYNRIINDAYSKLCAMGSWWWLETSTVLNFQATIASAHYVTAVEGASTVIASAAGDMLSDDYLYGWMYTGEHTYRIRSINSASLTMTLDGEWLEVSSVYSVDAWNDQQLLPSAFDAVVSVVPMNDPNRRPLRQVDPEVIAANGPDMSGLEEETAREFAVYRDAAISGDKFFIRIFPPPQEECEYVIKYRRTPVALSSDTDVPLLPEKFHSAIVDMARLELATVAGLSGNEVLSMERQAMRGMAMIMRDQLRHGNKLRRFGTSGIVNFKELPVKLTNYTAGDPI